MRCFVSSSSPPVLILHGGAGAIARNAITSRAAQRYRQGLHAALKAGWQVLREGGASLDAVCAAVTTMEDNPLFNAGRGAALNATGAAELDASVMDGATLKSGAVAGLHRAKNPILVARAIMQNTPHVFLIGAAADRYARSVRLTTKPPHYFVSRKSTAALARVRRKQAVTQSDLHGTVGAVALDMRGNLAAATSTGGYTNKMVGRVGDSAVIGAGTYADNRTCAVSCTGHGETFIRAVVAHDISARMLYGKQSLQHAVTEALATVERLGADGGIIAVSRRGNIVLAFNSTGMYRAYVTRGHAASVAIY